ncbi:hypothetical protein [Thiosocius teredinicola]|uniref:hypothetical protein n=1 Tax=Thiosocius teredinicola TaxID=1973002 RepID=UPI0013DE2DE5
MIIIYDEAFVKGRRRMRRVDRLSHDQPAKQPKSLSIKRVYAARKNSEYQPK